ncbi:hypothetical protein FGO68_gene8354 [Halteria grandinella]|uniref:TLDc domain-containing protein n=1 Tax=Halteria grandinella TaxID=5974 RepID=A0A8J8SZK2_HALGN|nr:hypothetical protein FGO68_gene8354 [Halteria grandinella]
MKYTLLFSLLLLSALASASSAFLNRLEKVYAEYKYLLKAESCGNPVFDSAILSAQDKNNLLRWLIPDHGCINKTSQLYSTSTLCDADEWRRNVTGHPNILIVAKTVHGKKLGMFTPSGYVVGFSNSSDRFIHDDKLRMISFSEREAHQIQELFQSASIAYSYGSEDFAYAGGGLRFWKDEEISEDKCGVTYDILEADEYFSCELSYQQLLGDSDFQYALIETLETFELYFS